MVSSRNSTLNVISTKITENLDKVFWKGKGDHKEFREKMKQFVKQGILTKEEYTYLLKNERRILIKTQLIHLIPELKAQQVLETTLRHLANVLSSQHMKTEGATKESAEEFIIEQLNEHFNSIFHPQLSSIQEVVSHIIDIIENSPNYLQEFTKISNLLTDLKDRLLERGERRTMIYSIDRFASQLVSASKSNDPNKIPSKDDLIREIKELLEDL
ncbi:MAG: hypothetical protein ACTSYD_09390 [Candidatus Heimdallarchaeaceae archaeon]